MKLLVLCVLVFSKMEWARADPVPDDGSADEESVDLVQRAASCPDGWSSFNNNCYRYIARIMDWASAEMNCMSMGGHLASVHGTGEYHAIQNVIRMASNSFTDTWIGGTNAQKTSIWFWSDGSSFQYTNWCPGEPNNGQNNQHCLQMNYSDEQCWDDFQCSKRLPSVCQMKVEAALEEDSFWDKDA